MFWFCVERSPTETPSPKRKLKTIIKRLRCQKWQLQKRANILQSKLNAAKQSKNTNNIHSIADVTNSAAKFLTPLQAKLFASQMKAKVHKKHSLRWSVKEELAALQLYYKSPKGDRYLRTIFSLPSRST